MSTQDVCSDTCTFRLVGEKRYCASYECEHCGTHDVVWRNNPMEHLHKVYYKKITPVEEVPDEQEGF